METSQMVQQGGAIVRRNPADEIARMIDHATEKGMTPEGLATLHDLYVKMLDREAASECAAAFEKFQRECPVVPKKNKMTIVTKAGGSFDLMYAKLQEILKIVEPVLKDNGFSHSYDCDFVSNHVQVTCILTHFNGHTKKSKVTIPTESNAGCSAAQKTASAVEFGKRLSFCLVCGIQTVDADSITDTPQEPVELVTQEQCDTLNDLCIQAGSGVRERMLKWAMVKSLSEFPASKFKTACDAINKIIKQSKGTK